jgi:RimJ/RimL family protein N-acetyltransferase
MQDVFETERLLLRRFTAEDGDALYDYLRDAETVKYEPYDPFTPEQAAQEASRRAGDEAFWAVCEKATGRLIGNIYFARQQPEEFRTWEIGYVFHRGFCGQGYATEAARRMLQYGFDACGAHRVEAWCNPENTRSWKLMERLGMRREGHFPKKAFFRLNAAGQPLWHDAYAYGMLEDEWARR